MGRFNHNEITATAEYCRIRDLPRRDPNVSTGIVDEFTRVLRTPTGTMRLRPVQALALHDIGTRGGLLGPIAVGEGKTLVSLLAPCVLESKRPLLLLPASLIEKTERERRQLMQHWQIPRNIRFQSYQGLGRVDGARMLELYQPDLIVADEAHRLKNPRAACTRRVTRYMDEHPDTRFVAMSGTLIKHSIRDFAKLGVWALNEHAPIPRDDDEVELWSNALDEKVNFVNRVGPGVLGDSTELARDWFCRRLLETPGIVSSSGDTVACSLAISALEYPVNAATEANFRKLRTEWATPDGFTYSQATDIWRHARELALGLHYFWDPSAPEEWLEARRNWAKFVREVIKNTMYANRPLDSELQVVNAVDAGDVDDGGRLAAWRVIRESFWINSKPAWHDDSALTACADWMHKNKGIVWVEHTFFANELQRRTGFNYYGAGGRDSRDRPIENESGADPIIASIAANATGRNLQMFAKNLITSIQPGADVLEQLIGRTHRKGQEADEVTAEILYGCAEHDDAFTRALADARMHEQTIGHKQKVLFADVNWPGSPRQGFRWQKSLS